MKRKFWLGLTTALLLITLAVPVHATGSTVTETTKDINAQGIPPGETSSVVKDSHKELIDKIRQSNPAHQKSKDYLEKYFKKEMKNDSDYEEYTRRIWEENPDLQARFFDGMRKAGQPKFISTERIDVDKDTYTIIETYDLGNDIILMKENIVEQSIVTSENSDPMSYGEMSVAPMAIYDVSSTGHEDLYIIEDDTYLVKAGTGTFRSTFTTDKLSFVLAKDLVPSTQVYVPNFYMSYSSPTKTNVSPTLATTRCTFYARDNIGPLGGVVGGHDCNNYGVITQY